MGESAETSDINKFNADLHTSKHLQAGDTVEIEQDVLTGKLVIKDIDEKDKEILRLKSEIEHLRSVAHTYNLKLHEFIANFENDCMDGIAEMRTKRAEMERFEERNSF